MKKNKHLTLDERIDIQNDLNKNLSFKAIGAHLGKDCTTISKEIRNHILFSKKGAPYRKFNDCIHRFHCSHYGDICRNCSRKQKHKCSTCSECLELCSDYEKQECPFLKKPPYVCNGCGKRQECTLEKHLYDARYAQKEYEDVRSESRSGFNLTEEELAQLNSIISPLLKNGQSLHHIMVNNSDQIMCCEKTAYTYIDNGLFDGRNIDMPRKVRFKPRKAKSVGLKVDKTCRIGRTYEDYKEFHKTHPELPVVELDSVEGIKGGAVLLTIHFVLQKFQLAFWRASNDSKSVTDIFHMLYKKLGKELYMKLFSILLCDNGSEFSDPKSLEYGPDGELCSKVFYCDPAAPNEKGACEVNHEFIRRVIPKGVDIGQYTQDDIDLMMNNINSYSRPELGNKPPYAMFSFFYGKKVLKEFHFEVVKPNDIILRPSLLKKPTETE